MKPQILTEGVSYTFPDYFNLSFDIEDILSYFGYAFQSQHCVLPRTVLELDRLNALRSHLEESLPYLSLTSEVARREFLIAPVLLDVVHYAHVKIKVEFPLKINEKLQGTLDYYLQAKNTLLIIEAKNADLQRGFTQLSVELIALDQWVESDTPQLYGAVSIGNVWQFGILDRQAKRITQDLNLYRVPADLEDLMRILVAILVSH
jgi:hypothetical protein